MSLSVKKIALIVFAAALVMRLIALASLAEEKSLLYVSDSLTYIQVAKNIISHGVYSMEIANAPHPDNFRTPVYPLFLLPFVWLQTSLYIPALLQIFISSAGIALIFWLGQKIFSRPIAAIAAIIFAIEPFGALISAQIMTEPLFITFFVPSLLLFTLYIKTHQQSALLTASGLLAISALTRPVAFYLFPLIPLAVILAKNWASVWKHLSLSVSLFLIILSPWLYYMTATLKTHDFSSISGFSAYAYQGRYFEEWLLERQPNTPPLEDVDISSINDQFDARLIPHIKSLGMNFIKSHLPEYTHYHFLRLPYLFSDSGYINIIDPISFLRPDYSFKVSRGGFLDHVLFTNPIVILKKISSQPIMAVLLLADTSFALMAILALSNPLWRKKMDGKHSLISLYLVIFLLAYAFLTSPIGGARYRIPVNYLIFILALDSFGCMGRVYKIKIMEKLLGLTGRDK